MTIRIFSLIFAFAAASSMATTVDVTVLDEIETPIEGAEVVVWFANPMRDSSGKMDGGKGVEGLTDSNGFFSATGEGPYGISLKASKEGYYDYGHRPAKPDRRAYDEQEVHKLLILPSIQNPIPLHALESEIWSASQRKLPLMDEWIGFDFEEGDWVKPHGEGKTSDVLFRYNGRG